MEEEWRDWEAIRAGVNDQRSFWAEVYQCTSGERVESLFFGKEGKLVRFISSPPQVPDRWTIDVRTGDYL